ncbi:VOC family protein [Glutamicibacter soli]|uniref:VOC family protein n=1 Tax=Glutamicibacter soli TaxID=453836 RepID=UPI003FD69B92
MTDDASALISFATDVFGAVDVPEARTVDTDGLILHSELRIDDSMITVTDRKPRWPFTPALIQVYVEDVQATIERAEALGAQVITQPTDFFGDVLARIQDPQANLWWIYRHNPAPDEQSWDNAETDDTSWESYTSPELEYIHSTLIDAMAALTDPCAASNP